MYFCAAVLLVQTLAARVQAFIQQEARRAERKVEEASTFTATATTTLESKVSAFRRRTDTQMRLAAARSAVGLKRILSTIGKIRAKAPRFVTCLVGAGFHELVTGPQVCVEGEDGIVLAWARALGRNKPRASLCLLVGAVLLYVLFVAWRVRQRDNCCYLSVLFDRW